MGNPDRAKNKNRKAKDIGALFANNNKTSPKSPDLTGEIVLDVGTIRHLSDCLDVGEEPKLHLAAWKNVAKSNNRKYLTVKAQICLRDDEDDKETNNEDPFEL